MKIFIANNESLINALSNNAWYIIASLIFLLSLFQLIQIKNQDHYSPIQVILRDYMKGVGWSYYMFFLAIVLVSQGILENMVFSENQKMILVTHLTQLYAALLASVFTVRATFEDVFYGDALGSRRALQFKIDLLYLLTIIIIAVSGTLYHFGKLRFVNLEHLHYITLLATFCLIVFLRVVQLLFHTQLSLFITHWIDEYKVTHMIAIVLQASGYYLIISHYEMAHLWTPGVLIFAGVFMLSISCSINIEDQQQW